VGGQDDRTTARVGAIHDGVRIGAEHEDARERARCARRVDRTLEQWPAGKSCEQFAAAEALAGTRREQHRARRPAETGNIALQGSKPYTSSSVCVPM
jgi:hypothetical protein